MAKCAPADSLSPFGDRRSRRVGLLGGSFNPAHEGHRFVALEALKRLGLDEVWLLVSPQNPLKARAGMAPLEQRLDSARRLAGHDPRLRATAIEQHLGTNFTADTLEALKTRFPKVRFVWLMGADNLAQITAWRRWRRIFKAVPVAVLARSPYSRTALASKAARNLSDFRTVGRGLADRRPPAWAYFHTRLHPASATEIRARLHGAGGAEHKEK